MKHRWISSLTNIVLILGFGGAIALLQRPQLRQISTLSEIPSARAALRQVEAEQRRLDLFKKLPSLGFTNLIADLIFLDFLQYFGDEPARDLTGYHLSPDYLEIILNKDPYFWDAYFFLTSSTTLYAGQPGRTVSLMNEKLPLLSPTVPDRAYFIWRWKAIDELLFLGKIEDAKRSLMTSAEWASVYPDEESQAFAEAARQTATFLETNPNSPAVRVSAWVNVFYNAFDDDTRQYVVHQINALGANASISPDGQLQVSWPTAE